MCDLHKKKLKKKSFCTTIMENLYVQNPKVPVEKTQCKLNVEIKRLLDIYHVRHFWHIFTNTSV